MRAKKLDEGTFEALRAAIRSSPQARRQHRIHAVLLVAGGLSGRAVARLFGDSPRTVEYWVKRYNLYKLKGLSENRSSGRPPRLTAEQFSQLRAAVAAGAEAPGWNGTAVSVFVAKSWGIHLGTRQAQRLLAEIRSKNTQ